MSRLFALAALLAASLAGAASADVVRVPVDHAEVIRLPRDAATVIIGNPLIADVTAHNGRMIFLTGRTFGATNIMAFDSEDVQIFQASVEVVGANSNRVTMQRGRVRETYRCAPRCESVPVVGDEPEHFGELFDASQAVADAASQGGSGQ